MLRGIVKNLYKPSNHKIISKRFSTQFDPNYHCKSDMCVSKYDCRKLGQCKYVPETGTYDNTNSNNANLNINFNDDHEKNDININLDFISRKKSERVDTFEKTVFKESTEFETPNVLEDNFGNSSVLDDVTNIASSTVQVAGDIAGSVVEVAGSAVEVVGEVVEAIGDSLD